jgi:hypothetical protein
MNRFLHERNPVLQERNLNTKTWWAYDPSTNSWVDTGRPIERGHSSVVGPYGNNEGGGRKPRHSSHKRSRRNSKKSKRVRHTRRKQTRRHRHRR